MMKKRLIVFAFAGMLAVGMSSCGKKEVSSNRVQSTVSEAEAENSISETETPVLSEEQPEQEESEEVQGNITQNTEDEQVQQSEQEEAQDNSTQDTTQNISASYADTPIILPFIPGRLSCIEQVETQMESLLV